MLYLGVPLVTIILFVPSKYDLGATISIRITHRSISHLSIFPTCDKSVRGM